MVLELWVGIPALLYITSDYSHLLASVSTYVIIRKSDWIGSKVPLDLDLTIMTKILYSTYVQIRVILTQCNKYLLSASMYPSLIILHFPQLDMFPRAVTMTSA